MLFLEAELEALGFDSQRIDVESNRWNLLARLGNGSPIICLNAHADTVPPSGESIPDARISDGKIYGLGSCDDKASIAAMICAFRALHDEILIGDL